ncbi:IS701 family transposase [Rhodopila sp.]|uniref:IS701 family transposase n=1 Tax=Rhodopila sp. TaxID=2480087 RepID=UPI003D0EFA8F
MAANAHAHWTEALEAWLAPFLARLKPAARQHSAVVYLQGLTLPGERNSIEPLAQRVAPGAVQQLHHVISTSRWPTVPVEAELAKAADRLVGGTDAVLAVDDTALVKKGRHSVGVAHPYCGQLGKQANCQSLVSLILARAEVPVGMGLRLLLPKDWACDAERRRAGVPEAVVLQPKWHIALDEIQRVIGQGVRFGGIVADAEYGKVAAFRLASRAGPHSGGRSSDAAADGRGAAAGACGGAGTVPQAGQEGPRRGVR